jgi:hypothetical protein
MQHCPCNVKYTGATWGISGDVCHILLCSSAGTLTMFCKSYDLELTTGMSATLSPTIHMSSIFDELFLLVRNV